MPRGWFGQGRDAQTLAAVRYDRLAIARPHDTYLVSVRDLERYVMKDLDGTEDVERLAAFDGEDEHLPGPWHCPIMAAARLGAKDG